jgi:hypothetical protein
MNPDLEKNILKQETNESLPKQELVHFDQEGFEKLSKETEMGINSQTESLVNKGSEIFNSEETKDYPEIQKLKELNQEITNLQHEAIDSVAWIKDRFSLDKSKKETFLDIEIQGTDEFREKIKNSLKFLSLAPEKFDFSQKYIKRIQEWSHSGMNMFKDKPTFEIGDVWKDSDEVYLASGIAHDAYHSHLCTESEDSKGNISLGAYVGKEAEKKCLDFQIKTLEDIGANDYMKDHKEIVEEYKKQLSELAIDPTYQDIPYEERNW